MTDSSCRIYHGSQLMEQLANLTKWGTWICQKLVYAWMNVLGFFLDIFFLFSRAKSTF